MLTDGGNKDVPDANIRVQAHWMSPTIPVVKAADDTHAPGVRRPNREVCSSDSLQRHQVRAELFIQLVVFASAKEMQVQVAEH